MISFLSCPPCLSFVFFFGGSVKAFALGLISLHLDALLCGEDYFPHAYLYEAFAILIDIPRLDEAFIFYLHHGLSQVLVILFTFLVCLWTRLLGVWGEDMSCTVYLIYPRLCWCVMLMLTSVFSSALPGLTHIILVEPILKLPLLHVAQPCACCKC